MTKQEILIKIASKKFSLADADYGQGASTGAKVGAGIGAVGGALLRLNEGMGIPGAVGGAIGGGAAGAGTGALIGLATIASAKALKILERKYRSDR